MPESLCPLSTLLCLAAIASLALARATFDFPQSFTCAISTYTLRSGDAPYEVCNINATGRAGYSNYLSMQWFTGTFDKPYGSESVLISM